MHELKINKATMMALNMALINLDELVGDTIAVTIILHDAEGGIYTLTDGPPGDLEIRFARTASND